MMEHDWVLVFGATEHFPRKVCRNCCAQMITEESLIKKISCDEFAKISSSHQFPPLRRYYKVGSDEVHPDDPMGTCISAVDVRCEKCGIAASYVRTMKTMYIGSDEFVLEYRGQPKCTVVLMRKALDS